MRGTDFAAGLLEAIAEGVQRIIPGFVERGDDHGLLPTFTRRPLAKCQVGLPVIERVANEGAALVVLVDHIRANVANNRRHAAFAQQAIECCGMVAAD